MIKKMINKYKPKPNVKQCSQCGGYFRSMIILNGRYVCYGCYNRRYMDTRMFHLV